jgi:hypothetical protein
MITWLYQPSGGYQIRVMSNAIYVFVLPVLLPYGVQTVLVVCSLRLWPWDSIVLIHYCIQIYFTVLLWLVQGKSLKRAVNSEVTSHDTP